jgi:hypothetical protein
MGRLVLKYGNVEVWKCENPRLSAGQVVKIWKCENVEMKLID